MTGEITNGETRNSNDETNANIEVILSVSLMLFSANAKNEGHIAENPKPRLN